MSEFLSELGRSRFRIEDEMKKGDTPTAKRIAAAYGYTLVGVAPIRAAPYQTVIFVSREVGGYNGKYVNAVLENLKGDGYEISNANIETGGRLFYLKLIMGKKFTAGGAGVMDRHASLDRNPVALAGYATNTSFMGFMLNTAPEHYSDAMLIAGLFEMEPGTRIPDAFMNSF